MKAKTVALKLGMSRYFTILTPCGKEKNAFRVIKSPISMHVP